MYRDLIIQFQFKKLDGIQVIEAIFQTITNQKTGESEYCHCVKTRFEEIQRNDVANNNNNNSSKKGRFLAEQSEQKLQLIYSKSQIQHLIDLLAVKFNNFVSFEKLPLAWDLNNGGPDNSNNNNPPQKQQQILQEVIQAQDMTRFVRQGNYKIYRRGFGTSFTSYDPVADDYMRSYLRRSDLAGSSVIRQILRHGKFGNAITALKRLIRRENGALIIMQPRHYVQYVVNVIQHHESILCNAIAFLKVCQDGGIYMSFRELYYDLYDDGISIDENDDVKNGITIKILLPYLLNMNTLSEGQQSS